MAEPACPGGERGLGDGAAGQDAAALRFAHMKSWPGLLRVLGGLELLCGGMVFACVCAYLQRDYGGYGGELLLGGALGGGYGGPLTPFVLVVASLAWLLTAVLLGLGATTYYRGVLLEAPWWPPTESGLNGLMFLLYLAAAAAYIHTVTLGGLCYSPLAGGPLLAAFCRLAGGQAAALVFLFLTALLYLAGSLVALKMWRHEVARRRREAPPPPARAKRIAFEDEVGPPGRPLGRATAASAFTEGGERLGALICSIPPGLVPRPCTVPDYVVKYPAIRSGRQREEYRAVFSDQHAEYRELLGEVREARRRLGELEAAARRLPRHALGRTDESRVARVWREVLRKKRDSAFLEKQRRCRYLKKKLTHIKRQIQDYDRGARGSAVYF
nr:occludin/ELL domain-containing protein 1 [Anser cygnoides]